MLIWSFFFKWVQTVDYFKVLLLKSGPPCRFRVWLWYVNNTKPTFACDCTTFTPYLHLTTITRFLFCYSVAWIPHSLSHYILPTHILFLPYFSILNLFLYFYSYSVDSFFRNVSKKHDFFSFNLHGLNKTTPYLFLLNS